MQRREVDQQYPLVFLTMPGDGVPSMAALVAGEGQALQQAWYTTISTEGEVGRPWTCAATLLLMSFRASDCNRLGKLTQAAGRPLGAGTRLSCHRPS